MRTFSRLHRSLELTSLAYLFIVLPARGQANSPNHTETSAAATNEASKAFWSGKKFYESGQFSQALEQFQRAYLLTKDPDLLYDIGQAHRKMGECALALRSYQDFLRLAPASPLAPQAENQASDLEASCPSSDQETNSVELPKEKLDREFPTPSVSVPVQPPTNPQISPRIVGDDSGSFRQIRLWTYVTLAAGVAAGGTVAVLELWNNRRYGDWSEQNQNLAQGKSRGETDSEWLGRQQRNDQLGNSIQRVDREVLFFSLGAGALLTTSAVLLLVNSTQAPKASATPTHRSDVVIQPVILGTKLVSLSMNGSF